MTPQEEMEELKKRILDLETAKAELLKNSTERGARDAEFKANFESLKAELAEARKELAALKGKSSGPAPEDEEEDDYMDVCDLFDKGGERGE